MTYILLKLLHVLLAIMSVGFTSTFGIIMGTATPVTRPAALGIVTRLEKVARVGFLGLVITGLIMGYIAGYGVRPLWFSGSLALAIVALTLAITVASPTLHATTALVARTPPPVDEIRRLAAKSRAVGIVLSLLSLTLIVLMVLKPG